MRRRIKLQNKHTTKNTTKAQKKNENTNDNKNTVEHRMQISNKSCTRARVKPD